MISGHALLVGCALAAVLAANAAAQHPITVRPNLDSPDRLTDWTLDGSGSWEISGGKLILAKAGTPSGPIRRPAALAIFKSAPFSTVTVEADVRSTAPVDLSVRDVQVVLGYESPTRFYYVHLSAVTDAVHNGIFVVADADRRRIDAPTGQAKLKDQDWHRVRVERDGSTGRIAVFFDGAPLLQATDTTIRAGRVGFASFDETGEFRNIVITGTTK
jgi:hypothetical protein